LRDKPLQSPSDITVAEMEEHDMEKENTERMRSIFNMYLFAASCAGQQGGRR
jgi:hypothetical protein